MSWLEVLSVAGAVFALVLVVAMPRLVLRPSLSDALWDLRDEIYDARRSGILPYDHPATIGLTRRVEDTSDLLGHVTPLRLFIAARMYKAAPEGEKEAVRHRTQPDVSDLDASARIAYDRFDRRFRLVVMSLPLLTSWSGLFLLVVASPIALVVFITSVLSQPAQTVVVSKLGEQAVFTEELAYERSIHTHRRQMVPA